MARIQVESMGPLPRVYNVRHTVGELCANRRDDVR